MTVRAAVRAIQEEVGRDDLAPARAAELLLKATALIGNCNTEIRDADMAYAQVLLGCLNSTEAANRARIQSEITPEYQRKREARDTKELVIEVCRALKYAIRCTEEEMRLTR